MSPDTNCNAVVVASVTLFLDPVTQIREPVAIESVTGDPQLLLVIIIDYIRTECGRTSKRLPLLYQNLG